MVKIPSSVLSRQQFTKLLIDFAMAESAGGMNIKNVPAKQIDSVYAFDPLKENHVTRAQYDSTLAFYTQHADLYQEVYQDVLTGLSAMQTHRDSLKTRDDAKHKADSLAALAKTNHTDTVKKLNTKAKH